MSGWTASEVLRHPVEVAERLNLLEAAIVEALVEALRDLPDKGYDAEVTLREVLKQSSTESNQEKK